MQNLVDAKRFPFTTQSKLSEKSQALIDSINLDELREMNELGETMSDNQKARYAELEEKHKIRREEAIANGWKPRDASPPAKTEMKDESVKQDPKQEEYLGDPKFRLSPEQASKIESDMREFFKTNPGEPIDLTKSK